MLIYGVSVVFQLLCIPLVLSIDKIGQNRHTTDAFLWDRQCPSPPFTNGDNTHTHMCLRIYAFMLCMCVCVDGFVIETCRNAHVHYCIRFCVSVAFALCMEEKKYLHTHTLSLPLVRFVYLRF